jgi:protein-tyrosine-phosphatase
MKILFICKHNKFRSKVSETLFKNLNKNPRVKAESAGIVGSMHSTPKSVARVLKEKGYNFKNRVARRVDPSTINDYDIVVIAADNVDPKFFSSSGYLGKIIWWKISDCCEDDIFGIKERVEEIEGKVKGLVKELKDS